MILNIVFRDSPIYGKHQIYPLIGDLLTEISYKNFKGVSIKSLDIINPSYKVFLLLGKLI